MRRGLLALVLGWRDLRRRATESLLLLAAITVAATALTTGLVLHGQTGAPYAATRRATAGPDAIGMVLPGNRRPVPDLRLAALGAVASAPGVTAAAGPFPLVWAALDAGELSAVAEVQGRGREESTIDRPDVVAGSWVRPGGVVLERAFATALGASVGDHVRLGGSVVTVSGIAVTAALPAYPRLCTFGCVLDHDAWHEADPGLVWATSDEALGLVTRREPAAYVEFLRLADPAAAPQFAAAHSTKGPLGPQLQPWQEVARRHAEGLRDERAIVLFGGSLLVVLALATVALLVGGRMADEVRRVGALKALGASPGFVVRMLLTAYLLLAVLASVVGVVCGRLLAPLLVAPSAGLLGSAGSTSVGLGDAAAVTGAMVAVVLVASVVPAFRAARRSTISALADAGRRPRRTRSLVALSARLPAPALVGLRLTGRRPRRALLIVADVAVTLAGCVVVLYAQASIHAESGPARGPADPNAAQLNTVMAALTVLLASMAALTLVFATRSAAAEARTALAVVRALGASPAESAVGLAVSLLLPATVGVIVGMAGGVLLFGAFSASHAVHPSPWALLGLAVAALAVTGALAALPARLEARRSIASVLRAP